MALNTIGPHDFVTMTAPVGIVNQTFVRARSGVDGHDVWRVGARGEEFQVRTFRDFDNLPAAWQAYHDYLDLTGTIQTIVWENQAKTIDALIRNVHHTERGVRSQLISIGGLSTSAQASTECIWTLLSMGEGTNMATIMQRDTATATVSWNASALSDPVNMTGYAGGFIHLPAGFAGTTLKFHILTPDSAPAEYRAARDAGAEITLAVTSDAPHRLPETLFGGFSQMKIETDGGSQTVTAKLTLNS